MIHSHHCWCLHFAYSHPLNEHCTQHCSLHSLLHKRQSISAMFSSNKISQHNLLQHTIQTQLMHSTVSAFKMDHICHAQQSNYIAATHNITHSPCTSNTSNMHSTPSTTHPTAFHNPPMHTTNKHKA